VSLVQGEQRRKNVCDALVALDDQIRPLLKVKKRVVIKINNVEPKIPVACTHVDALMGIMDYLAPRFKGPVVIAEASARDSLEGFENNHYSRVAAEFKSQQVSLVDLNREGKYEVFSIVDANIRPIPVRLAARLLDPDAFVVCSTMLKTHNAVVATLSVKNMVIGTPLHSAPGDTPAWHDKQKYHAGPHQMNYNMAITAARLRPHWGVAVIDGYPRASPWRQPTSSPPTAWVWKPWGFPHTRWVTCYTRRSSAWASTTWRRLTCWESSRKR
jgi:hypothetical protein